MDMIVAYDIAEPRRLKKLAKIIEDYGTRVQKSIFELSIEGRRFNEMRARVEGLIEASEDGVKYFPLCEKCAGTVEIIGQGVYLDPDEEYQVI